MNITDKIDMFLNEETKTDRMWNVKKKYDTILSQGKARINNSKLSYSQKMTQWKEFKAEQTEKMHQEMK